MRTQKAMLAIAVCGLLALPYRGLADGVNSTSPDRYAEPFEYDVGTQIVGLNGWSGSTNSYVTNVTAYTSFSGVFPLDYDHVASNKSLYLEEEAITNSLSGEDGQVVYCDFMGQLGYTETNTVSVGNDVQLAFLVDTNGHLILYHSLIPDNTPVVTDLGDQVHIASDAWVRITILADYRNDHQDDTWNKNFFQIRVNGSDPLTSADGYNNNQGDPSQPGSWFVFRSLPNKHMSSFSISGKGWVDDLVIGTNPPSFIPLGGWSVTASASAHGSVSPTSTNVLNGNSAEFAISVDNANFYHIANILTNGVQISGGVPPGLTSTNWTWPAVYGNGTLSNVVAETLAPHGVPRIWLDGLTNASAPTWDAAADADFDSDGMTNWQEYVSETNPKDSNSVLKVSQESIVNGSNVIQWVVYTNSGSFPPYGVEKTTNLMDPNGWGLVISIARSPTLTNTYTEGLSGSSAAWRVIATNAPAGP